MRCTPLVPCQSGKRSAVRPTDVFAPPLRQTVKLSTSPVLWFSRPNALKPRAPVLSPSLVTVCHIAETRAWVICVASSSQLYLKPAAMRSPPNLPTANLLPASRLHASSCNMCDPAARRSPRGPTRLHARMQQLTTAAALPSRTPCCNCGCPIAGQSPEQRRTGRIPRIKPSDLVPTQLGPVPTHVVRNALLSLAPGPVRH